MIKINVITNNINWFSYIKNPNNYLEKKIKRLNLELKNLKKNELFFSLLLSDKKIKKFNKKFRKKNKSTDVLSFPFYNRVELKKMFKNGKDIYLGDVIINLNKVRNKNSIKKFKKEFDYLWIHGFVHLFGYDHKKEKDFLKMNQIEKKYFNLLNV